MNPFSQLRPMNPGGAPIIQRPPRRESNVINAWFLPSGGSAQTLGTFPNTLLVREFSVREPNMAMLIEGMLSGQANASDFSREGDAVVCSLISTTIVSAAIRLWAELGCAPERWLHQVSDPFIARALDAIHESPGDAWTVRNLAQVATMSRSAFAERFTTLVGQTPASYLTEVRMETSKTLLIRWTPALSATTPPSPAPRVIAIWNPVTISPPTDSIRS
ncbi:MAG: AraC family transcriptional regulator [Rhodococcus sp. (in: high G+C Gram-positive bacteria)]|nr:MAG: AraC family transcriptional regulator [Rhodococcus sp. (in: high G+C Gram-positive bacteria)]